MIRKIHPQPQRRGVVMIVVVVMLAFFSVVALGFVIFAESEATTASYSRQASAPHMPDVHPDLLASQLIAQLLYGTTDPSSCLRGLSLSENMYGFAGGCIPFNGMGRLEHTPAGFTLTNFQAINPIRFFGDPSLRPVEKHLNAPYTYPDLNNILLAAVTADGRVLIQSAHRPWTGVNLSSTTADDKYRTLRPHRSYHPQFPLPADAGGDVKNLSWGLGANGGLNDSYWIDIGGPVHTAPDGRKYKALYAILLTSLDNRLNLAVTGNHFDPVTNGHASGPGLGRHEINLGKAFADPSVLAAILGKRYGSDTVPSAPLGTVSAPVYAATDFNMDLTAVKVALPVAGDKSVFPTYDAKFVSGKNVPPRANHPLGFSHRFPVGDDVPKLSAAEIEVLLRYGDTGSSAFTSIMPGLLGTTNWSDRKARQLITTLSSSLDRPGWAPMFKGDLSMASDYKMRQSDTFPKSLVKPTITYAPGAPPAPAGDFSPDWQSTPLARVDVNRKLRDYPAVNSMGVFDLTVSADQTKYDDATRDRRKLAQDIYDRFVVATGALTKLAGLPPTDDNYRANRYLAQLAINIVDYIDADEYSTTWLWNSPAHGQNQTPVPEDYVIGTELPKVVINEAYSQLDNDPKDVDANKKATFYLNNTWVELFNPLPTGHDVTLIRNNEAAYRLLVVKKGTPVGADPLGAVAKADIVTEVIDWEADANEPQAKKVISGDKQDKNQKSSPPVNTDTAYFYLLGPKAATFVPGNDPKIADGTTTGFLTHATPLLSRNIPDPAALDLLDPFMLVLQRLANPDLPHNDATADIGNLAKPYNPYVTIDFIEEVKVNDNRAFDKDDQIADAKKPTDFVSTGRLQPYVAKSEDQKPLTQGTDQPKHTFGELNRSTNNHYDQANFKLTWLVHLDRQLQSIVELKYASAQPMHLLTQKFWDGSQFHQHLAHWDKEDALLFRSLELLTVGDRTPNNVLHGQVSGKINPNEIWDVEILRALLDAQPNSHFTDADVDALFTAINSRRDAGQPQPNANSKPFMGFGAGVYAAPPASSRGVSSGMSSTMFGLAPPSGPGTHPFFSKGDQMLGKALNNITFTSNTFALWATVGFFEVTDDTVVPPRLGEELNRKDNRHIRHRFFAVIDRTEMIYVQGQTNKMVSAGSTDTITVNSMTPLGQPPVFRPGMMVEVGAQNGTTLEVVIVKSAAGNSFTADFQNTHPSGTPILVRGYAGPVPRYDVTKDNKVVPHFSVIE